jgi:plasmid stability protein
MTTRLPDALQIALAARAEANHRSANAELIAILTQALSGTPAQANDAQAWYAEALAASNELGQAATKTDPAGTIGESATNNHINVGLALLTRLVQHYMGDTTNH